MKNISTKPQNTRLTLTENTPVLFQSGLTLKSFVIASLLIPITVAWIIQLEVVRHTFPTLVHPLSHVIFTLFWLVLIGWIFGKISPKLGLSQQELLTIYFMLCIVSTLCSYDCMEIFVPIMAHAFRFASPENEWRQLFWRQLPEWLTVHDEKAVAALYEGGSSLYVERHLKGVAWSSGGVDGVYLCVDDCNAVYQRAAANPVDRARTIDLSLDPTPIGDDQSEARVLQE